MGTKVRIGLLKAQQERQPAPVERFLINDDVVPFDRAHLLTSEAMKELVKEVGPDTDICLYIVGFTRAVLGAVAGFMSSGSRATLRIYEYNDAVSKYETRISFWASERPEGGHCYAMHLW